MEKYYVIVNKDRIKSGNKRAYLIRGGGMISDDFWWSYRPHALIFTNETILDKFVTDFLEDYNYEIECVDKSNLPLFHNFY